MKSRLPLIVVLCLALAFTGWFALPSTAQQLTALTGEEARLSQLRGLWNLLLQQARPPLQLAPDADIQYVKGISPFGINIFLEQEVEVPKRERILQMVKDSGYA